jgi:LPXTG-motif cell wall-anchored protein
MSISRVVRQGSTVHVKINLSIAVIAAAALSTLGAVPAQAASVGYVRLAHFSPDTPAVDVYLSSQSGAIKEKEIKAVAYGALSDYFKLPVGGYTVAMRAAGAPKSQPPVLTTQVSVTDGSTQTVAGVGRYAELGLKILQDDLSLPASNKVKVRLIQASIKVPLLALASNGSNVAQNVGFATTTPYQQIEPGVHNLEVKPSDGRPSTTSTYTFASGSVYSLLVLDAPGGGLKTELRKDASRQGGIPLGGVETGGGGTAGESDTKTPWLIGAGVLSLLVAGGVLLTIKRRRSTVL